MSPFDKLYYEKQRTGQTYSSTQLGPPVISRLVEGKSDYWLKGTNPKTREKKTLVLTDWRCELWEKEELNEKLALLRTLIVDQGFTIYAFVDGQQVRIDEIKLSHLDDRSLLKKIDPVTEDYILRHTDLSKDELFLLNHHHINELIMGEESIERIPQEDIETRRLDQNKVEMIYESYKEKKGPVIFSLTSISENLFDRLKRLQSILPDASIEIDSERFLLEYDVLQSLLKEGKLDTPVGTLSSEILSSIKKAQLEPRESLSEEAFVSIIKPLTQLEELQIIDQQFTSDDLCTTPQLFSTLKSLYVESATLRIDFLSHLLSESQAIRELFFADCTLEINEGSTPSFHFPSLHTLKFVQSDSEKMPIDTIKALLNGCPRLENIMLLYSPSLIDTIARDQDIAFPHMKSLSLSIHHCSEEALLGFLSKMPHLEELFIEGGHLSATFFKTLSMHCPHLKGLNLQSVTVKKEASLDSHESLPLCHFPSLQSLKITTLNADINTIDCLLHSSTNLEQLEIKYWHPDGKIIKPRAKLIFPKLKNVSLTQSSVATELVEDIISSPESIQHFEYDKLNSKSENASDADLDFNHALFNLSTSDLKSLCIYHKSITSELLILFSKAPKLKKLELKTEIDTALLKDPIQFQLPRLRALKLKKFSLPFNILNNMLLSTQHLEMLDLYDCNFSDDSLESEFSSHTGESLSSTKMHTLRELNKIRIINCHVSLEEICHLLALAPELNTLSLERLTIKKMPIELLSTSSHFRTLTLEQLKIDSSSLHTFLGLSHSLERLNLKATELISDGEDISLDDIALPHLTEIDISGASIPFTILSDLISSQDHPISISGVSNSLQYQDIRDYIRLLEAAQNIKNVDLSNQKVTPSSLQNLLKAGRHVKNICLRSLEITPANEEMQFDFEFPNLTSINFSYATLPLSSIKYILKNAPQLKYCHFSPNQVREFDEEIMGLLPPETILPDIPSRQNVGSSHRKMNSLLAAKSTSEEKSKPGLLPLQTSQARVDANTTLKKDKEFHVTQHFYPVGNSAVPSVNHERQSIYDSLTLNASECSMDYAFLLEASDIHFDELPKIDVGQMPDDESIIEASKLIQTKITSDILYPEASQNMAIACHELQAGNDWQALPSCWVNESLLLCKTIPPEELEFVFSSKRNQYYVRRLEPNDSPLPIEYVIAQHKSAPAQLTQDIEELVERCRNFEAAPLKLSTPMRGRDYVRALEEQKVGACRHRAIVFKYQLAEMHPEIPVRIVENECHMFVEIQLDGIWQSIDLGGYPAKLTINTFNAPDNPAAYPLQTQADLSGNGIVASTEQYLGRFNTWDKSEPNITDPDIFFDTLSQTTEKRTLVSVDEAATLEFTATLLRQAKQQSRPIYIVNSPEDLVCSMPHIVSDDGVYGHIELGQGGKLHDFLIKHQDDNPIIAVNYNQFTASDIVRYNQLLDKEPRADGTPLPKGASVIGLIDTASPNFYSGADFYSRFTKQIQNPIPKIHLDSLHPLSKAKGDTDYFTINLFHASDWYERLMGRWVIKDQDLFFEQGALSKAIASGKTIELLNGCWDDPNFVLFFERLYLDRTIDDLSIPEETEFVKADGYPFQTFLKKVSFIPLSNPESPYLNPSTLSSFIQSYQVKEGEHGLFPIDGLLHQHDKYSGAMKMTLSRSLNEDEWAAFLDEALKHDMSLDIQLLPGVTVPEVLIDAMREREEQYVRLKSQEADLSPKTFTSAKGFEDDCLIQSTDIDLTVSQMKCIYDDPLIIDVSELNASDLIGSITGRLNLKTQLFEFNRAEGLLTNTVKPNKHVILKGHISDEILDALTPYILDPSSTLHVIAEPSSLLDSYQAPIHLVTAAEKLMALQHIFNTAEELDWKDIEERIEQTSFISIQSLIASQLKRPEHLAHDPWIGMQTLPDTVPLDDFQLTTSKSVSREFLQKRLSLVDQTLTEAPFAVLTGATGVGKSTFVQNHLGPPNNHLYTGENQLLAWAHDMQDKRKILFIDEANITDTDWTCFEGLFQVPPHIVIDGELIDLDENHKVVFAMNPQSYGDERHMPALFERHGNAVLFEPMPLAYLYEEILSPLFELKEIEPYKEVITEQLLNVYQYLCLLSKEKILISPRELKMISMLIIAECKTHPERYGSIDQIKTLTDHYIHMILMDNVPPSYQTSFKEQYPLNTRLIHHSQTHYEEIAKQQAHDYVLTPSRHEINHALDSFLTLRSFRRDNVKTLNETQLKGGLGAFIIEGEPGIGKSELLKYKLMSFGVSDYLSETASDASNVFYHIPVSMQFSEKERLLREAFDRGAIVIMDEINSSPSMERLLNALLMGFTPEGKKASVPGFMLIGTQNPVSMSGRMKVSQALNRRSFSIELCPYDRSEMSHILIDQMDIDPMISEKLIDAYLIQKEKALLEHLKPVPCFRDLLSVASEYQPQASEEYGSIEAVTPATKQPESLAYHPGSEAIQTAQHDAYEAPLSSEIKEIDLNPSSSSENSWGQQTVDRLTRFAHSLLPSLFGRPASEDTQGMPSEKQRRRQTPRQ